MLSDKEMTELFCPQIDELLSLKPKPKTVKKRDIQLLFLKHMIATYKEKLYRTVDIGLARWIFYENGKWTEIGEEILRRMAILCIKDVMMSFNQTSFDVSSVKNLIYLMKGEPSFHINEDVLDRLDFINFKNGTFHIDNLGFHYAGDYISKKVEVAYEPVVPQGRWHDFLVDFCRDREGRPDPEFLEYLQLIVGYSLHKGNPLQKIFFLIGNPNTGKTTFLEAITDVFEDYCQITSPNTIMATKFQSGNSPDVAALEGKRLVVCSEIPKGLVNEELVKRLTGDQKISATAKYKAPKTFRNEATIWIDGNVMPEFKGDDKGIEKRVVILPMEHIVPKVDIEMRKDFRTSRVEQEEIANWVMEGYVKAGIGLKGGEIPLPPRVQKETHSYFEDLDYFSLFLSQTCEVGEGFEITFRRIRNQFEYWAVLNSYPFLSPTALGIKLREKGFEKKNKKVGGRVEVVYDGLKLITIEP